MRLATIATPDGLRLHVRDRSGYVDAAEATGNPRLSSLQYVLQTGLAAMDALRPLQDAEGRPVGEADFGPAVPAPRRILCLGLNYGEHALEGGRAIPTWPDAGRRPSSSPRWPG